MGLFGFKNKEKEAPDKRITGLPLKGNGTEKAADAGYTDGSAFLSKKDILKPAPQRKPALQAKEIDPADTENAYQAAKKALKEAGGKWDGEVLKLYKKAADLGHPHSAELTGNYYADVLRDYKNGLQYLELSVSLGRKVCYNIATIYDIHYIDYEKADEWYKKGAAAGCQACAKEIQSHSFRN